ncbi:hypothetical protein [Seonamhaeicola sp. S2-3]|uniref:hypothetical protein n=1 Tax=Seonamhaeicola sp. S2-3 TaxID=1936081 RepID=UPI0012F882CE|nr:hypothetical protein [Seonamhaeicola sp. S2-3]
MKNPKLIEKAKTPFFKTFKEFMFFDIVITLGWAFLVTILILSFEQFEEVFKTKKAINTSVANKLFITALVAPLIEETAYRLSLKINRLNISISIGTQIILYLFIFRVINFPLHLRIILMGGVSLIIYLVINKTSVLYLKKKKRFFIYYNIIAFSLLHAFNFSFTSVLQYSFIPFLVSLQFCFGLYLSYARLSYGFKNVLLFHVFHNLMIILISQIAF